MAWSKRLDSFVILMSKNSSSVVVEIKLSTRERRIEVHLFLNSYNKSAESAILSSSISGNFLLSLSGH
jgi:hypothetical protein